MKKNMSQLSVTTISILFFLFFFVFFASLLAAAAVGGQRPSVQFFARGNHESSFSHSLRRLFHVPSVQFCERKPRFFLFRSARREFHLLRRAHTQTQWCTSTSNTYFLLCKEGHSSACRLWLQNCASTKFPSLIRRDEKTMTSQQNLSFFSFLPSLLKRTDAVPTS